MRVASWLAVLDGRLPNPRRLAQTACGIALGGILVASTGCQNPPEIIGPVGGPVTGALDTHCQGVAAQPTNQSSCTAAPDLAGPAMPDMATGGPVSEYGTTLYNAEGNDDDCKYHLKFAVTPVRKSSQVTFTVIVTNLVTSQPTPGAALQPEVFLSEIHPAPNSGSATTESPPGTYVIGPIVFDASGRWTVRYHLFDNCNDGVKDSPHGHGAFYVDVP